MWRLAETAHWKRREPRARFPILATLLNPPHAETARWKGANPGLASRLRDVGVETTEVEIVNPCRRSGFDQRRDTLEIGVAGARARREIHRTEDERDSQQNDK